MKKVLIIEDELFKAIYIAFFINEYFDEIYISNSDINEYNDDIYDNIKNEPNGNNFELTNLKSNQSFNNMSEERIKSFDIIILDYNLDDGSSECIAEKLRDINFKGPIIANSDSSEYNEKLVKIVATHKNEKLKTGVVEVLENILTDQKKSA